LPDDVGLKIGNDSVDERRLEAKEKEKRAAEARARGEQVSQE